MLKLSIVNFVPNSTIVDSSSTDAASSSPLQSCSQAAKKHHNSSRPTMVTYLTDFTYRPQTPSLNKSMFDGSSDLSHLFTNLKRPFKVRVSKNHDQLLSSSSANIPSNRVTTEKMNTESNNGMQSEMMLRKGIQKPVQLLRKSKSKCKRAISSTALWFSSSMNHHAMSSACLEHQQQQPHAPMQPYNNNHPNCAGFHTTEPFPNLVSTSTNMVTPNKFEQFTPQTIHINNNKEVLNVQPRTEACSSPHHLVTLTHSTMAHHSNVPTRKGRTSISIQELLN
ncbi:hypothetical protein C9374_000417 [Naegleria lovaniensis]|uniref:Uncharacterized protein n=1 Tax=Naegleria lovaniensis TaxID=51637 RepID=A0AA88KN73_NAELO|nr:uncharacterized protein C9374_000417 [Naegleria lovaniensis]KAG2388253.1 hypothetical protein C9374_000417 [Naegleria lovaniensis]